VRFEKVHEETYRDFGFELVSVEPRSLVERVISSPRVTLSRLVGRPMAIATMWRPTSFFLTQNLCPTPHHAAGTLRFVQYKAVHFIVALVAQAVLVVA